MKIYTKKGDTGTTQLLGGMRVSKDHPRIEAYGTVDELNCWIGYVKDAVANVHQQMLLKEIQDRLFSIGSQLASAAAESKMELPELTEADVELLEKEMDDMTALLPELKSFVLPGGNHANSVCHIARAVCRRAERHVVRLHESESVSLVIIRYLNRLSDFLFVLARKCSFDQNTPEVTWQNRQKA